MQGEAASHWSHKHLIVAHDLLERLSEKLQAPLTLLGSLTGAQLAGCQYRHPLFDRTSPVVIGGDYITTESGTGLVHSKSCSVHVHQDTDVASLDSVCDKFLAVSCAAERIM